MMERTKIRQGNDFTIEWEIMQNMDAPIETTGVTEERILLVWKTGGKSTAIPGFTRIKNKITLDVTPTMASNTGSYLIEWYFKQPSDSFASGYRHRVIDSDAFVLVPKSEQSAEIPVINIITILNS